MKVTRLAKPLILVLLLGLPFVTACDDTEDPVQPEILVSTELVINDGEEPVEVGSGDWLGISLRFTTNGEEDVEFDFASSCRAGYDVLFGGEVVLAYPVGCAGEPANLMIRSIGVTGLTLSVPTLKYDMDNMEYGSWLYDSDRLAPGEYTVRAGLLDNKQSVVWPTATFTVQ